MSEMFFTVRQVARLLHVGDRQVRQWVQRGELTAVNLGDVSRPKHRVQSSELQRFIESRRVTVPSEKSSGAARKKSHAGRRWF